MKTQSKPSTWRSTLNTCCLVIGIFIVMTLLYRPRIGITPTPEPLDVSSSFTKLQPPLETSLISHSQGLINSTEPVRNIFLLKIHKAGSTTLQNIIYRYGVAYNLKIAVFDAKYGMPFPDIATQKYLFEDINKEDFKPYNIMADHAVFSKQFPYKYMEKDTITVASLREPMSYLKSAFSFFGLKKFLHLKTNEPVYEFLSTGPESYRKHERYNWTKNLQLFSFGYQNRFNNNPVDIMNFIKTMIEPNIKHMIILDHFDEGMILLKRRLNWSTKDIVYRVLWSTSKAKKMPDQTDKNVLENMNNIYRNFSLGDYILYDYFKQKVETDIKLQDNSFLLEVKEYQEINKEISKFCSNVCSSFNKTKLTKAIKKKILQFLGISIDIPSSTHGFHDGFSWSYSDCALMGFFTFDYQIAIRVHQFPNVCTKSGKLARSRWTSPTQKKYQKNWCSKDQHMIYSFPWRFILDTFLHKCK